jgi:hypothetical protein
VAKVKRTGQAYQRKSPKTIGEFIRDMNDYGIALYWTGQYENDR